MSAGSVIHDVRNHCPRDKDLLMNLQPINIWYGSVHQCPQAEKFLEQDVREQIVAFSFLDTLLPVVFLSW